MLYYAIVTHNDKPVQHEILFPATLAVEEVDREIGAWHVELPFNLGELVDSAEIHIGELTIYLEQ